jgi:RNA polymerase sigma-70 factor (sigma-E family)
MPDIDQDRTGETTSAQPYGQFADAFDALYRRAYQSAFKLLGDRHDAEDVAQEACTRACLRWSRLDNPTAWVVRVSTNLSLDRWRRAQRARAHRPTDPYRAITEIDERRVDLHRALATLPKRQREVVVLRYVADLSEADTAAALGCAQGTVKAHAARGLSALRAALELPEDE